MRAFNCLVAGSVVVGFVALLAGVRADEEKVALDKLPKAVAEAVRKRFPQAEMISATKETEAGKVEYEVTIKDGGTKTDVMLTPSGSITVIEKEIPAKDLPKAVRATVRKEFPKATYKRAEEVTKVKDGKEMVDFYEVLLETPAKKKIEAQINPDGKLRKGAGEKQ